MRIALHNPEIPQNSGGILRLCACFGIPMDVIEPCGFEWSDAKLRRAGLDYIAKAHLTLYPDWPAFREARQERLILATTKGAVSAYDFAYEPGDVLLFGSEGHGVPEHVHQEADARVRIPMRPGLRSFNLAMAAGMILGEALRVTGGLPEIPPDV